MNSAIKKPLNRASQGLSMIANGALNTLNQTLGEITEAVRSRHLQAISRTLPASSAKFKLFRHCSACISHTDGHSSASVKQSRARANSERQQTRRLGRSHQEPILLSDELSRWASQGRQAIYLALGLLCSESNQ